MKKKVANELGLNSKLNKKELKEKTASLAKKFFDSEVEQFVQLTKVEDMYEGYDLFSVNANVLQTNPLGKKKKKNHYFTFFYYFFFLHPFFFF